MEYEFRFVKDQDHWRAVMAHFPQADFHHSFDFHAISQAAGEGTPQLLVGYHDKTPVMAWPLLARQIPDSDDHDLGSVYGYAGPLFAGTTSQINALRQALHYLQTTGFVSVAARLHPLSNAPLLGAEEYPEIRKLGPVVAVDLSRPRAELKREIRGAKNGTIKKVEKTGVTVRESREAADTPVFQAIYRETMTRIEAAEYYYFSDAYMTALLRAEDFDACYQIAELDGAAIAAASFIDTVEIRQYYLSGTADDHTRLSPMSLILRDQIFAAQEKGLKWFVLGGGLGGQSDSLTHFKLGFSKTTFVAGLVCKVLQPETYAALSAKNGTDTQYFPAYRKT